MIKYQSNVVQEVISQHAEEAAFQWLLRDAAVGEPHYDLKDIAELDDKVEAHLDGLRIAGNEGWELCKQELGWKEAGEAFAAGVIAFESGDKERIETVLEAAEQAEEARELARGLTSALGWIPYEQAKRHIEDLLQAESPYRRLVGIGAIAVHRRTPGTPAPGSPNTPDSSGSTKHPGSLGQALANAMRDDDLQLRARALQAAGELGLQGLLHHVRPHLRADDEACRFWAAWSAALLGEVGSALPVLRQITEANAPYAQRAAAMALRLMQPEAARQWYPELGRRDETKRLAVIGAGVVGDPACMGWLFEMMQIPQLARVAGEAFSMITGIDLAYDDLETDEPEGFEAGPTEDPDDEDVTMDADEDLPWPDPSLIKDRWAKEQARFQAGTRCLMGKPITPTALQDVLRKGMQRQRIAAAIELALRQPGHALFEVRARGDWQLRALGIKK